MVSGNGTFPVIDDIFQSNCVVYRAYFQRNHYLGLNHIPVPGSQNNFQFRSMSFEIVILPK